MFRSTLIAMTVLLASCSSSPTSPAATDDFPGRSPAGLAAAVTASSASCSVSSSPEFTASVSWSKLPVQRIVLWHSLGDRSYTETLNHQTQKGTVTVLLGFEPVLAVLFDRAGIELARATCT